MCVFIAFLGLGGCHDGGGNGLITHLRGRHCNGDALVITKQSLTTNLVVFKCRHGKAFDFVSPLIVVMMLLVCFLKGCALSNPSLQVLLGFSRVLKGALDKVICTFDDISCLVSLLALPLCLLTNFSLRSNLESCEKTLVEPSPLLSYIDVEDLDLSERHIKQCKRKICDGHYMAPVIVLSSSVVPYNNATLEDLVKNPFKCVPSLPYILINHHQLIASLVGVLGMIKIFSQGMSCRGDGLCAQHLMDFLSDVNVAISDELVASITQMVNLFLNGKCLICWLNILIRCWSSLMIRGSFNLSLQAWYLDDDTIIGDTLVVGKVLVLVMKDGPRCGLYMNVDINEVFLPKQYMRSRIVSVFLPNIARPLHGVKLLGGPASVDFDYNSNLVIKRVAKTIKLMDAISMTLGVSGAKINEDSAFPDLQICLPPFYISHGCHV
ncbi:hypothetical protein Tco_0450700 [Tanacetum coccineum]